MLNPQHATMEPSPPECDNSLFSRRFGVLIEYDTKFAARKLSNSKLLRCYSIPEDIINQQLDEEKCTAHLDDSNTVFLIKRGCWLQMKFWILQDLLTISHLVRVNCRITFNVTIQKNHQLLLIGRGLCTRPEHA